MPRNLLNDLIMREAVLAIFPDAYPAWLAHSGWLIRATYRGCPQYGITERFPTEREAWAAAYEAHILPLKEVHRAA